MESKRIQFENEVTLMIGNNGYKIASTNYYDTEMNAQGGFYLSGNAGALRLLVPDSMLSQLDEMKTGKSVEIEVHENAEPGALDKLQYQIYFEDGTSQPFAIFLSSHQTDRALSGIKRCKFLVYTRDGLQLTLPCKVL